MRLAGGEEASPGSEGAKPLFWEKRFQPPKSHGPSLTLVLQNWDPLGMVPSALTYLQLPVALVAALVALSLVWLVLALVSVASKGGTGCGQAPTGCVPEGLLGSRPILPSPWARDGGGYPTLGAWGCGAPGHSPSSVWLQVFRGWEEAPESSGGDERLCGKCGWLGVGRPGWAWLCPAGWCLPIWVLVF